MNKYFKRSFKKDDNQEILLYGYKKHNEKSYKQLNKTKTSTPHLRFHPFRDEWVAYSVDREKRTFFPSKEYCPLCPSGKINKPTEIPFRNFEIAVFQNRWSSFNQHKKKIKINNIRTDIAHGKCEVVVYSDNHTDTISEMSIKKIELLVFTWIDRYINLLSDTDVKYVMPFENRGEECGVTLHHPHGQIYAYPFIPPIIEKEILQFEEENYFLKIMTELKSDYLVYQNEDMIVTVPPFARYAYEVWIIPKKKIPGPWAFNYKQIKSYADCLKKVVKGYDSFLQKKCPYVMGLHAAPSIEDNDFHFHTEFCPPLRSADKSKKLGGSETMAGVFIMDVLPEDSAKILKKYIY